ncbi:MAG TPA: hypothetical protein VHZ26_03780 [Caulobacteraceae bacterium]|jgi:hypothetical protein|nr:hypothetical protein [Caulobacteraceae bacterium]
MRDPATAIHGGARFDDRSARWGAISMAGGCLLGLATLGLVLGAVRYAAVLKARAWVPAGPPCPAVSRREYLASGFPAARSFDFQGLRLVRAYGYVSCAEIHDDGGRSPATVPVCQFNDPGAVVLGTPRGQVYYLPRYRPITVTLSHGRPSCVLAANLGPDWLRS